MINDTDNCPPRSLDAVLEMLARDTWEHLRDAKPLSVRFGEETVTWSGSNRSEGLGGHISLSPPLTYPFTSKSTAKSTAVFRCYCVAPMKVLDFVQLGGPKGTVRSAVFELVVVDANTRPVKAGEIGALVIKLPLPPGAFPTLWNADKRFVKSYLTEFPGYYKTADAGYIDEDGYVYVMARTDDIINVAGHRLSTGGMEEVLAGHPDVAECAVIGVDDQLKGQLPVGFVVLNAGAARDHGEITAEVVQMVRQKIGPVAAFKTATVVERLPKTRSGKILRGTMQKIANGEEYKTPATIDDPAILDEIAEALNRVGYPRAQAQ